jgi:hypothetical protein
MRRERYGYTKLVGPVFGNVLQSYTTVAFHDMRQAMNLKITISHYHTHALTNSLINTPTKKLA